MTKTDTFEKTVEPHLPAAYNLARWLTRRDADAEDVVQEAMLRAFRFFSHYRGGDARSWFLTIIRNTSYSWLRQHRSQELTTDLDAILEVSCDPAAGPEAQALRHADQDLLRRGLDRLPLEFREVLVLRELEGFSYKEICAISGLPMGTVMSRLSRARDRLLEILSKSHSEELRREL